jgi:D-alanyl-D-alanine carboxypeptidase
MKKFLFTALGFLSFIAFGYSQSLNQDKLDSLFDSLEVSNKFMGSIAISENGKIAYKRSIGYSDVATSKKSNN